jgi:predicted DNA-binding protein
MPAVKSIRLDAHLQARLSAAAARVQMTESEFIRDAVARRADEVLGAPSLYEQARDLIGSVHGGGGVAERADEVMEELLMRDHERQKVRRRQSAAS